MMKKTYVYGLLMGLFMFLLPAQAQNQLLSYPTDTVDGKVYYLYTVERSIGLYRISVNFGVTQEEILQANPHLQHQGLRFEEVIRIPAKTAVASQEPTPVPMAVEPIAEEPAVEEKAATTPSERPTRIRRPRNEKRNRLVLFDDDREIRKKKTTPVVDTPLLTIVDTLRVDSLTQTDTTVIRLAYLLPLHADAIKRDKNMERFYDFYAGALIAIYETQAQGQRLDIHTFDIGKTAQRTKEVIANHPEIRQMDAIIGPAYSQQVTTVIDSLKQDSIWCLIPFLSRVDGIDKHTFLMKFNPSQQIEADTVARYLAQRKDSVNCVLIEQKEGEVIPSGIAALHKALKQHQVPTSTITLKALLTDSVEGAFHPDKENIIIFNTERYANLQTVMPHLLRACGNYHVTLFSHYSWQNEKIILPQLYTSVFAPMPIVPDDYEQLFEQYFDHELSSDQPRYDLLGYDLTKHLLGMLQQQQMPNDSISHATYEGIQANIHYLQTNPQGGLENHIVHIIHQ